MTKEENNGREEDYGTDISTNWVKAAEFLQWSSSSFLVISFPSYREEKLTEERRFQKSLWSKSIILWRRHWLFVILSFFIPISFKTLILMQIAFLFQQQSKERSKFFRASSSLSSRSGRVTVSSLKPEERNALHNKKYESHKHIKTMTWEHQTRRTVTKTRNEHHSWRQPYKNETLKNEKSFSRHKTRIKQSPLKKSRSHALLLSSCSLNVSFRYPKNGFLV